MKIMAARMHNKNVVSGIILGLNFAGIRQPGFFFNRQGIKLGTQHHCWARPIF